MESRTRRTLVAAAVAGLLAGVSAGPAARANEAEEGAAPATAHCYGINKCQGTGDCGGKGRSCAGTNACKGQGYLELSQDDCLRIEGGRLTEEPAA